MELYEIKIKSEGNGWKSCVSAVGEVSFGKELCVKYSLDGDECEFITDGRTAVQRRRGVQNILITFICGRSTRCVLGRGDLTGSYAVYTKKLKLVRGEEGFSLLLEYLSGNEKEKIKLNFKAIKNKKSQEFK